MAARTGDIEQFLTQQFVRAMQADLYVRFCKGQGFCRFGCAHVFDIAQNHHGTI